MILDDPQNPFADIDKELAQRDVQAKKAIVGQKVAKANQADANLRASRSRSAPTPDNPFSDVDEILAQPLDTSVSRPKPEGVTIDLSDFVNDKFGTLPVPGIIAARIAQSLGFTPDEAEEYARQKGQTRLDAFYSGYDSKESGKKLVELARTDPSTLGRVSIPGLTPSAIGETQAWLKNHRAALVAQQQEAKHNLALDSSKQALANTLFLPKSFIPNFAGEAMADTSAGLAGTVGGMVEGAGNAASALRRLPGSGLEDDPYSALQSWGQGLKEVGGQLSQGGAPAGSIRKDLFTQAGGMLPIAATGSPVAIGLMSGLEASGNGASPWQALKAGLISGGAAGAMGRAAGKINSSQLGTMGKLAGRVASNIAIGEVPLALEGKLNDRKAQLGNATFGSLFALHGFAPEAKVEATPVVESPTLPTPTTKALPGYAPWERYQAQLRAGMAPDETSFVQGRAGVASTGGGPGAKPTFKDGLTLPPDLAANELPGSIQPISGKVQEVAGLRATGKTPLQIGQGSGQQVEVPRETLQARLQAAKGELESRSSLEPHESRILADINTSLRSLKNKTASPAEVDDIWRGGFRGQVLDKIAPPQTDLGWIDNAAGNSGRQNLTPEGGRPTQTGPGVPPIHEIENPSILEPYRKQLPVEPASIDEPLPPSDKPTSAPSAPAELINEFKIGDKVTLGDGQTTYEIAKQNKDGSYSLTRPDSKVRVIARPDRLRPIVETSTTSSEIVSPTPDKSEGEIDDLISGQSKVQPEVATEAPKSLKERISEGILGGSKPVKEKDYEEMTEDELQYIIRHPREYDDNARRDASVEYKYRKFKGGEGGFLRLGGDKGDYKLEKRPEDSAKDDIYSDLNEMLGTFHSFNIIDQKGGAIAPLDIIISPDGTSAHVNWVGRARGGTVNVLGPRNMRGLARQLKEHFPDLESVSGFRISGIRGQAEKSGSMTLNVREPNFSALGQGNNEAGAIRLDALPGVALFAKARDLFRDRTNDGGLNPDPDVAATRERIHYETPRPDLTLKDKVDRGVTKMVEEFHPMQAVVAEAEKLQGHPLRPGENPYSISTALRSSAPGKVFYMIFGNMIDGNANPVGKNSSLESAIAKVRDRRDDFNVYLWSLRARERWGKDKDPGMEIDVAHRNISALEDADFKDAASKVHEWNRGVLRYVKDVAPELGPDVDRILANSDDYIPLARVFETDPAMEGSKKFSGNESNPLKRMVGGSQDIYDPFPQMVKNAERLVAIAHKRRAYSTLADLAKIPGMENLIQEVRIKDNPTQAEIHNLGDFASFYDIPKARKGIDPLISVKDANGIVHQYKVPVDLYNTLEGLDFHQLHPIVDALFGKTARLFNMGTTGLRPSFSLITNPIRDAVTFLMQTQADRPNSTLIQTAQNLPHDIGRAAQMWSQGMKDSIAGTFGKHSDYYDAFLRLSIPIAQPLGADIASTRTLTKDLYRQPWQRKVMNSIETTREFLSMTEAGPRIAEMRNVGQQIGWDGKSPLTFDQMIQITNAAKQVTVDFSAAGSWGKWINRVAPFFNANIQGSRQMARNLNENPRQTIVRGLAAITIPTLLHWWANKDKEWYREMPNKEKALYWHIEDGDKVWQLPKSQDYGGVFASIPELLFDGWYHSDRQEMLAAFGSTLDNMIPNPTPQTLRPIAEQLANKEFYFDKPIVPQGDQQKSPGEQFTPYTSKLAKILGQAAPEYISPERVDHAVRSVFGGLGPDVLSGVGLGRDTSQREPEPSDTFVLGRLFRRGGKEGTTSKTMESFYDTYSKAQERKFSTVNPESEPERFARLRLEDTNAGLSFDRAKSKETYSYALRQDQSANMRRNAQAGMADLDRERILGSAVDEWVRGGDPFKILNPLFKSGEISPDEFNQVVDRWKQKILESEPATDIERKFKALGIREMLRSFRQLPEPDKTRVAPYVRAKTSQFYSLPDSERKELESVLQDALNR